MAKCMACKKNALFTTAFDNVVLCNNCGKSVNVSLWKSRDFETLEELKNQRDAVVKAATSNNFPQEIVAAITRYFYEYIESGFVTAINGKAGQVLKVFSDHCIVYTKSESKKEALIAAFSDFDGYDDSVEEEDDGYFSSDDKRSLVKGLMSGRIVQAGIGAAISATINKQEQEKNAAKRALEKEKQNQTRENKLARIISVGERRINLHRISNVEIYSKSGTSTGYLRFVPEGISPENMYNCEYFFFNNSILFESKKIKQRIESARNIICNNISNLNKKAQVSPSTLTISAPQKNSDAFEDIRKYKQLLDEGIISEEEFLAKKKELLGL